MVIHECEILGFTRVRQVDMFTNAGIKIPGSSDPLGVVINHFVNSRSIKWYQDRISVMRSYELVNHKPRSIYFEKLSRTLWIVAKV